MQVVKRVEKNRVFDKCKKKCGVNILVFFGALVEGGCTQSLNWSYVLYLEIDKLILLNHPTV